MVKKEIDVSSFKITTDDELDAFIWRYCYLIDFQCRGNYQLDTISQNC